VQPGLGSPPARRSDASWWATSLLAFCGAAVLLVAVALCAALITGCMIGAGNK
jgi:hypothetical protein